MELKRDCSRREQSTSTVQIMDRLIRFYLLLSLFGINNERYFFIMMLQNDVHANQKYICDQCF